MKKHFIAHALGLAALELAVLAFGWFLSAAVAVLVTAARLYAARMFEGSPRDLAKGGESC